MDAKSTNQNALLISVCIMDWTIDTFSVKFGMIVTHFRDCSLFIGSTGPVFWGTGQGLFSMLPSTGHKDFLCLSGT